METAGTLDFSRSAKEREENLLTGLIYAALDSDLEATNTEGNGTKSTAFKKTQSVRQTRAPVTKQQLSKIGKDLLHDQDGNLKHFKLDSVRADVREKVAKITLPENDRLTEEIMLLREQILAQRSESLRQMNIRNDSADSVGNEFTKAAKKLEDRLRYDKKYVLEG